MSAKKYVRFESPLWESGYVVLPKKVLLDATLGISTRLFYAYLCDLAREKDEAFPGQKKAAEALGMGERTVRDAIRELESANLLVTTRRGLGHTNTYRLTDPADPEGRKAPLATAESAEQVGLDLPIPIGREEDAEEEDTVEEEDSAALVWEVYDREFPGSRGGLSSSRRRMIERGLKEGFTVEQLQSAVLGLKKWRERKPGDTSLSAIFKTRPGGSSFADQVEFWITQAPTSAGGSVHIPSADRAKVAQRQQDVQRGHRLGHDPGAVRKAREAEAWLLKCGIATDRSGDGGYPTFRAATPDEVASVTAAGDDS